MPDLPYAALSHQGITPENNEDAYFADADLGLWFVADGMGGHASGEVASRIVKNTVSQQVAVGDRLADAITQAHDAIIEAGREGVGNPGMGSTIVALQVAGYHYQVAWVGDSRAYLWDGALSQLSHDHSVVQTLLDRGVITTDEAFSHPDKNLITQALGTDGLGRPTVDVVTGQLLRGQRILLCSDGLNDELPEAQIRDILAENLPPQETVDRMIQTALDNGGHDNVTAILVSAGADAPESYTNDQPSPFAQLEQAAVAPSRPSRIGAYGRLLGILVGAAAAVLLVLLVKQLR